MGKGLSQRPIIKEILKRYKVNRVLKEELILILEKLYLEEPDFKELIDLLDLLYQSGYKLNNLLEKLPKNVIDFEKFWRANSGIILKQIIRQSLINSFYFKILDKV